MGRIEIASPDIGEAEKDAVMRVMDSGNIAQGPEVAAFEREFADFVGVEHAVMVNSGTAALHAALEAIGVGPGDEVITTPFSFIATVNPIIMQGAEVQFADIDPETFNIDPRAVQAAITQKTKAIVAVDLFGQPYDYEALRDIADIYGIALIEDACQAVGAQFEDRVAGSLGDAGCFSFYPTKNMTTSEGGAITTDSAELAERMRQFRQHGMTGRYQYEGGLGYNYRSTDIAAAIGRVQLKRVTGFNEARNTNAAALNEMLGGVEGLTVPQTAANRTHVFHQYTIRVGEGFGLTRDELAGKLAAEEIGAGVYYPMTLDEVPHIKDAIVRRADLREAKRAAQEVLSLPVHPKVTPEQIERIGDTILRFADD